MAPVSVLLELKAEKPEAFELFEAAVQSSDEATSQAEKLLDRVAGLGIELKEEHAPVPMFSTPEESAPKEALSEFAVSETNPDVFSPRSVVAAQVPEDNLDRLRDDPEVRIWPNSELTLLETPAAAGVDCRPFQPAATVEEIQALLEVKPVWDDGHRGEGIVVGILDEGLNGQTYPVDNGLERTTGPAPGSASITSHGSMCAADVLIAAPDARLYDYPFLGVPDSGGALGMFQAVLERRRVDGTPHLTNNSYGFVGVPSRDLLPEHEIWDLNHPLHRKVREVIASGAPAFFAAGNCGKDCPSGNCDSSGIGLGKSIHAANSLAEVITIAAVNKHRKRIGYSSQGPGMFAREKPDLASYSHIFANFGPGRPGGGTSDDFDNGTSAATPVACGVGALLLSAKTSTVPANLKAALVASAQDAPAEGWDADIGHGVISAAGAYAELSRD